jgi:hypothetical protein
MKYLRRNKMEFFIGIMIGALIGAMLMGIVAGGSRND